MIDRIEELLGSLAAEDEEEREDVPALPMTEGTVLFSPHRDEGEAGDGGTEGGSGGRTAGETAEEKAEAAGELWKDGPVWTVRGAKPEMNEAQKAALSGRMSRTEEILWLSRDGEPVLAGLERAALGGTMSPALEGAGRSGAVRAGLEGLYRQTVRGMRPSAPVLLPEQAGRTVREYEPGSAASQAVDELDRAVRRDSRRYDGGMSIY